MSFGSLFDRTFTASQNLTPTQKEEKRKDPPSPLLHLVAVVVVVFEKDAMKHNINPPSLQSSFCSCLLLILQDVGRSCLLLQDYVMTLALTHYTVGDDARRPPFLLSYCRGASQYILVVHDCCAVPTSTVAPLLLLSLLVNPVHGCVVVWAWRVVAQPIVYNNKNNSGAHGWVESTTMDTSTNKNTTTTCRP